MVRYVTINTAKQIVVLKKNNIEQLAKIETLICQLVSTTGMKCHRLRAFLR